MRTVVIGRSGQVARALSRLEGVKCIGRPEIDLADPGTLSVLKQHVPDAIINAAAFTDVDGAEQNPSEAWAVNAHGVGALAASAEWLGVPFVQVSTDYVFDGRGTHPWTPDAAPSPVQVYGASKRAGELAALKHGGSVLRVSWVISEYPGNFATRMCALGYQRSKLSVVADQFGAPTPAHDVAHACLALAKLNRPGVYHYAGWPNVSWAEVARAVFAATGQRVSVREISSAEYGSIAQRPLNSRLDCSEFTQFTGLARPDWRAALTSIVGRVEEYA